MNKIEAIKKFEIDLFEKVTNNINLHLNEFLRIEEISDEDLISEFLFFSDYHHNQGDFDAFLVTAFIGVIRRFQNDNNVLLMANKLKDNYIYERWAYESNHAQSGDTEVSNPYLENELRNLSKEDIDLLKPIFQEQSIDENQYCRKFIDTTRIENYFSPKNKGCVYVVENKLSNTVKIGKSKNPYSRVKSVKNSAGGIGRYFISEEVYHYGDIEEQAHTIFAKSRHHGEWFFTDFDEAVRNIKKLIKNQKSYKDEDLKLFSIIEKYNDSCGNVNLCTMMGGYRSLDNGNMIKMSTQS